MDLTSIGIGLLGNIFGGGQKTPDYVLEQQRMWKEAIERAQQLYDSTDLAKLDAQAVDRYSQGAMQRAQTMLQNYDAKASGAGSPYYKSDTAKDRSRTQIAADSSLPVAQFEAGLMSTRPQRQASLLPNPSQAAAGFNSAAYLDQSISGQNDQELQGMMDLARLVAGSFKKSSSSSSSGTSGGANDRYGIGPTGTTPAQVLGYKPGTKRYAF